MAGSQSKYISNDLIAGEGEMAELTRAFDWASTPVGPVQQWPQSLKTSVNIILNTKFPMFLWWGPHLVQFYNDAYRPSLGNEGKHPQALGQTAENTWQEIWHIIKPLIDQVLQIGKPTWSEDQLIPIYRNGKLEDVYWTFGYSPVFDEKQQVAGVLVVCNETTEKVLANKYLKENQEKLKIAVQAAENSEINLRNLIVQAPVAMAILQGPEFIVEIANQHICDIWGRKPKDVLSKPVFEALPEAREQVESLIKKVYESGERFTATERPISLNRNGKEELLYLNFVYEALRDSAGKITGIMAVASDVTSQVLTRMKVEESEQEFRQLADSLPHIVWTASADGAINYYNKQWYEFTGFKESYGDKSWIPILHPDDVDRTIEKYYHSIRTGEPYLIEYRFKDKSSGGYRWFLGQALPIKDAEGRIVKWFGSCTDIDMQKSFTEKLSQKVAERTIELQKMNTELQNFAYVASHDLQEPLRKIQTYSDRILEKEHSSLSDGGKEYFRRLQSASGRMQSFINDLLEYSRTNNPDLKVELTDLNILLGEVTNELKDKIIEKNAVIQSDGLLPAYVVPFQFRQVMQNLIGNALKFSKPGIAPIIKISSEMKAGKDLASNLSPDTEYYHLRISDNGIGFESQYRQRIFEMFQRLNGRSEYEGTGIGLAIVNKIIDNHKGIITADSELGNGAAFDIYIPASRDVVSLEADEIIK